jgi:WD40 repeat protein
LLCAPVSRSEVVVLADSARQDDAVIEAFISPNDFPARQVLWTGAGDQALFALDASLSATPPIAELHPERLSWPRIAGYPLRVEGGPLKLHVLPRVLDDDLDRGIELRILLVPTGLRFEPFPSFCARIGGVDIMDASSGRPLLRWTAPESPPACRKPSKPGEPSCEVPGIGMGAVSLATSPDGSLVGLSFSGLRPRLEMYDITAEPILLWQALLPRGSGGAIEVAFSADGRYAAVLTGRGALHRFDARSGEAHLRISSRGRTARPVPPGYVVAVAGEAGEVTLWYLSDGTIAWRLPPRQLRGPVDRLAASSDGRRLVTLEYESARSLVRLWDIPTRKLVAQLSVDPYAVADLAVADDGRTVIVSHGERGLLRADAQGDKSFREIPGRTARQCRGRIAWVDGSSLVSCSLPDGEAQVDLEGKLQKRRFTQIPSAQWLVSSSAEGRTLAGVGAGHLVIWRQMGSKEKK